jgi:hypothetical protein
MREGEVDFNCLLGKTPGTRLAEKIERCKNDPRLRNSTNRRSLPRKKMLRHFVALFFRWQPNITTTQSQRRHSPMA